MSHSERARQWVHMGSAGFALLLRVLTWWQAALLATFALAFNAVALPHIGGRNLYRPADEARGFPLGILLYPLSVLLLILVFPTRMDIVAAAWGILALGDGMATIAGQTAKRKNPALPWNSDKTVAGTVAFIVFGSIAGVALALWTRPSIALRPPVMFSLVAPIVAAVAAAFVETIPVRLDDNISVPFAAAVVLWLIALISPEVWANSKDDVLRTLPWAAAFNTVIAWLGFRAGTVSISGAFGGAVVGVIIYAAGGAGAWILLFTAFLIATVTSRLGLKRKMLLGIAEERGGRRGAGNAFANCGVATLAAISAVATPYTSASMLALTAALAAGGSDTVASEIGKAWGRSTFLIVGFSRVKPGTPGAMSLEGTAAGIVAALALAALAVALGLIPSAAILAVVIAATVGALVESALGATLEPVGILNNDMLNFINTTVAAAVAIALV